MHQRKFALAVLTAAVLAGCGGNGSSGGDQTVKIKYSAQVAFGDSLSDVGSYAVGGVKDAGGGKFTINGDYTSVNSELTGKNWTELMAAQLGLPAPCAAQTGLTGDPALGFAVAVVNHSGCFGYAQGGSRVADVVAPGNGVGVGALALPVAGQIQLHLAAVGGKFKGDEAVFVTVGGNDTSGQLAKLAADAAGVGAKAFATNLVGALAAGATNPATAAVAIGTALAIESARPGHTDTTVVGAAVGAAAVQPGNAAVGNPAVFQPIVAAAKLAGGKAGADYAAGAGAVAAVTAMATAGAQTVALVKDQIVAKGANYVIVNNLPDFGNAPVGKSKTPEVQTLINTMVAAFNKQLLDGLTGNSKVLLVDLYKISHDQIVNPGPYGLTNTTTQACLPNAYDNSALFCTGKTLIAGDVSHYMFADDRHPTPFEYSLIARYVAEQMIVRGWM
ncbi:SGNH/GDSL hydrolase family protein [Janthinobacterium sp.]|uniref:SGNH/GDSL hydrolase family protein n=1 Tax=Janthinobacterium sp. TaxID=1871054 RepID=UPI00293D876B|nr:SGNH/GDSL hydrolase family protein [Janthinobacterium sp.]